MVTLRVYSYSRERAHVPLPPAFPFVTRPEPRRQKQRLGQSTVAAFSLAMVFSSRSQLKVNVLVSRKHLLLRGSFAPSSSTSVNDGESGSSFWSFAQSLVAARRAPGWLAARL